MGVAATEEHQQGAASDGHREQTSHNNGFPMEALLSASLAMGAWLQQSNRGDQQAEEKSNEYEPTLTTQTRGTVEIGLSVQGLQRLGGCLSRSQRISRKS